MSNKQILVVEDDHGINEMMAHVLELEGFSVHRANDGSEALEILKSLQRPPCLILLDLMMKGMNGWEFLAIQRSDRDFARIPVVICSAYRESAKALKPSAFIPKPIELDCFLASIKDFCA